MNEDLSEETTELPTISELREKTGDTVKKMLTKDPIQLAKEITKRGYGSDTQELLSMIKKGNKEKSNKHTHRKEPQKN